MLRVIILNLRYLFSKNNLVVLGLILSVYTLLVAYESRFYLSLDEQILNSSSYQSEYNYIIMVVYQLLLMLFSCYIFSLIKNDSFYVLIKTTKLKFYFIKILSNILIVLILACSMFFLYFIFGMFTSWFKFDLSFIRLFLKVFLQSIVFGLISNNISYLLKTNFGFIFVFLVYIVLENTLKANIFGQLINVVFPVLKESNLMFFELIIPITLYFFTGFCLFKRYEIY